MTTAGYILTCFNLGIVLIACFAVNRRKIHADAELKIKTLEGHIATLQRVIAALIDLRDEVQRTHRLAQAIAEAVSKPKTGLAPTPVTLTPPHVTSRKAARAAEANRVASVHRKGGRP